MIAQIKAALSAPIAVTPTVFWGLLMIAIAFYEGVQLGTPNGTPATTVLRTMRFDVLGRFVIGALLHWLLWHVFYRPRTIAPMTRFDLIPIAIGIAAAFITGKYYALGGVAG